MSARRNESQTLAEAHASRPTSSGFGKCTVDLKTTVPDSVKDDLDVFIRLRGYASISDFLREQTMVALYGAEHVANLHRERIESLSGNRPLRVA